MLVEVRIEHIHRAILSAELMSQQHAAPTQSFSSTLKEKIK